MTLRSRLNAAERRAAARPGPAEESVPSLTDRIEALAREYEADPGKFARDYDQFWAEKGCTPLMSADEASAACEPAAARHTAEAEYPGEAQEGDTHP